MDKLLKRIEDNFILIISFSLLLLTLLAILAPVFGYLKLYFLSDPIYWFFQFFCHQRPWRSYHLFDYQVAMDSRMITLFLSTGIGGLIAYLNKLKPLNIKFIILFIIIGLAPMAIDGTVQLIAEISLLDKVREFPFYESTNLIRSLTGVFAGTAISLSLFPLLNTDKDINNNKYIPSIITTVIISLTLIPILVFSWFVTSVKYVPSGMFIDNERRFPGYNYEIVTNAGHSTIKRIMTEPIKNFIERAKYYNREIYLTECSKKFQIDCKRI